MTGVSELDRNAAAEPEEATVASEPTASESTTTWSARPLEPGFEDFDYKPVPILAPVSLVVGVLSLTAFWAFPALAVAFFGTVVGVVAVRKIAASDGEYGGFMMATAGCTLATLSFLGGAAYQAYLVRTEVPEGYQRIHFASDVSKPGLTMVRGRVVPPPPVQELVDRKVFIKGYMYPMEQTEDLRTFLLVKDNQQCCFGAQVAPQDKILVTMENDRTADYSTGLVSVAGTFRFAARPSRLRDQGSTYYHIDADLFERAKTAF